MAMVLCTGLTAANMKVIGRTANMMAMVFSTGITVENYLKVIGRTAKMMAMVLRTVLTAANWKVIGRTEDKQGNFNVLSIAE